MAPKGGEDEKTVASNRKARHDFQISQEFECGIVLTGDEVKSLRGGRASINEAFARVRDGEVWLEGMHIPPYEQGDVKRHLPERPRKLLLHRREIHRLAEHQQEERLTLIPLRVYFTHGLAKVELGRRARQARVREASIDREAREPARGRTRDRPPPVAGCRFRQASAVCAAGHLASEMRNHSSVADPDRISHAVWRCSPRVWIRGTGRVYLCRRRTVYS